MHRGLRRGPQRGHTIGGLHRRDNACAVQFLLKILQALGDGGKYQRVLASDRLIVPQKRGNAPDSVDREVGSVQNGVELFLQVLILVGELQPLGFHDNRGEVTDGVVMQFAGKH